MFFLDEKDQELIKLSSFQTSLMFTSAYSMFQLTYWPPSLHQIRNTCKGTDFIWVFLASVTKKHLITLFIVIYNMRKTFILDRMQYAWGHLCPIAGHDVYLYFSDFAMVQNDEPWQLLTYYLPVPFILLFKTFTIIKSKIWMLLWKM
jgi:hypothetical protein